jgi:hypothetical protein
VRPWVDLHFKWKAIDATAKGREAQEQVIERRFTPQMAGHALPERLHQALAAIHSAQPRLIAAPPAVATAGKQARGKRASVAISEWS